MALTIGTQLGSHEITALLGKGGMGEVYRARDLKLKREVAIKILPEEFSQDAERLARFQREAEVLASLNHPNIAAIYDLQSANDARYLVLELIDGETLADRIATGPIPVDEALQIAAQICEALEAAHEKGIVHRDLKPGNIKITPDGKVKILDFGLAKAMSGANASAAARSHQGIDPSFTPPTLSNSPTMLNETLGGMILGTAAYMSPEQARGKTADKRADIWAFGVVLYEMVTGRTPFTGSDVSEILAAVIKEQPSWEPVPEKLTRLLRKCLEKDPKQRLRDIGDASGLLDESNSPVTQGVSGTRNQTWKYIAAAMAVSSLALGFAYFRREPLPARMVHATVTAPETDLGVTFFGGFAVSPDGQHLAYSKSSSIGQA